MHIAEELEILSEDYTKVTFRMKRETVRRLKVHCAQNDTNITDVLTKLVEDYLDSKDPV
jgi:hypothetical protein